MEIITTHGRLLSACHTLVLFLAHSVPSSRARRPQVLSRLRPQDDKHSSRRQTLQGLSRDPGDYPSFSLSNEPPLRFITSLPFILRTSKDDKESSDPVFRWGERGEGPWLCTCVQTSQDLWFLCRVWSAVCAERMLTALALQLKIPAWAIISVTYCMLPWLVYKNKEKTNKWKYIYLLSEDWVCMCVC